MMVELVSKALSTAINEANDALSHEIVDTDVAAIMPNAVTKFMEPKDLHDWIEAHPDNSEVQKLFRQANETMELVKTALLEIKRRNEEEAKEPPEANFLPQKKVRPSQVYSTELPHTLQLSAVQTSADNSTNSESPINDEWICPKCTFLNVIMRTHCQVCETGKPPAKGHLAQAYSTNLLNILKLPAGQTSADDSKSSDITLRPIFDELHAVHKPTPPGKSKFKYINFEDLCDIEQIGEGYFNYAFRAKLFDSAVVIKAPKSKPSKNDEEELDILLQLPQCDNVIAVLGLCVNFGHEILDESRPSIVIPYQKHEDLKSHLNTFSNINDDMYINVVLGMSKGIAHLHKNNIIHRDIALRNFLVNEAGRILISDFGLSRTVQDPSKAVVYYAGLESKFPLRWCAPETLLRRKSTQMSDIWMFGVTILELFEDPPFSAIDDDVQLIAFISGPAFYLKLPKECPPLVKTLAELACQKEPAKRPSIADIADVLMGKKPLFQLQTGASDDGGDTKDDVPGNTSTGSKVPVKDLESWTKNDVCKWVSSFGDEYQKYGPIFNSNGIDGETLVHDLDEAMKLIPLALHRNKIIRTIKKLQR